jgi:hypothetical protein
MSILADNSLGRLNCSVNDEHFGARHYETGIRLAFRTQHIFHFHGRSYHPTFFGERSLCSTFSFTWDGLHAWGAKGSGRIPALLSNHFIIT